MEPKKKIAALQCVVLALGMVIAAYSAAAAEEPNMEPGSTPAVEKSDQGPSSAPPAEESGKQPNEPGSAGAMEEGEKKPPRDLVLKGDAKCTRCHNENEEYPVLMIGRTEHGTVADTRTPTCTSCHGDSEPHLANKRVKPDRMFAKSSTTPIAVRNQACLTCHQGGKRIQWQGSVHQNRELACTTCHQIHIQHDKVRVRLTQPEVCFTCHKEQRVQIIRPYRHPILEGKVVCSDCHNPHGSVSPPLMVRNSINETCYTCHMEKRGPYVRNHPPVQENCALCHNPHGTINPSLLKVRLPFLCQECHEPTSHRGNIPNVGVAGPAGLDNSQRNSALIMARGCENCHTNIHGSNNPGSTSATRSFRR